ncbi:DUF2164 domain-containing protein [Synechococcus sp. RedBA-s]|uniref:DUF2164 domain-containing protein n=1 Tax=Synechococcus sp. RedBA-s TaxID=2823741 RepID=UPI0020CC5CE1|nr:DUF2164 domain-containing protein [Synechococcus sp. RedBA-s]MCP9799991.1 DUF2164 domain-containing protein [Synechococcus sp. RedBA-s]
MAIQLSKEAKKEALASIIRFFAEHRDEEIGLIAAGALLEFILSDIAPSVYNKAIAEALERLSVQLAELDIDLHEEEFPNRLIQPE